jgi:hypothetical protein
MSGGLPPAVASIILRAMSLTVRRSTQMLVWGRVEVVDHRVHGLALEAGPLLPVLHNHPAVFRTVRLLPPAGARQQRQQHQGGTAREATGMD